MIRVFLAPWLHPDTQLPQPVQARAAGSAPGPPGANVTATSVTGSMGAPVAAAAAWSASTLGVAAGGGETRSMARASAKCGASAPGTARAAGQPVANVESDGASITLALICDVPPRPQPTRTLISSPRRKSNSPVGEPTSRRRPCAWISRTAAVVVGG